MDLTIWPPLQMILSRYALSFLALNFTLAAEVEIDHEIKEESNNPVIPTNKTYDLIDVLWVKVSEYLPFPQRELGFLNKTASYAVFKLYPYRNLVAEKLRIPELLRLKSDHDMAWFADLIFAQDPVKILHAVSSGFLDQRAFPNSKGQIALYLLRSYFSLSPQVIPVNEIQLMDVASALVQLDDYSYFPIIATYPLASYVVFFASYPKTINFIKSIFSASEEDDPELFAQSVKTFNAMFNNENIHLGRKKLLYCAVLAGIPEKVYMDTLISDPETFLCFFVMPLARSHPKLSIEESERIYSLFDNILDRIPALEEMILNYKIIGKIAYKTGLPAQFYENEIANGTFDHDWMQKFAAIALHSGKVELFKQLFADPRLQPEDDQHYLGGLAYGIVYAVNAHLMAPERNFAILLKNHKFFKNFVAIYDPMSIILDENAVLTIKFARNQKSASLSVPEFFEFAYDTESDSVPASTLLQVLLFNNETLDDASFIELVRSIITCPFFQEAINTAACPIEAMTSVIRRFARSQELCLSGLKLQVDTQKIAELFRHENVFSTFIIDENYNSPGTLLEMMVTPNQIRNYEIFTGRNIVDAFLDIVTEVNKTSNAWKLFNRFRKLARFILKGPHRQRLLELQIPEFLQFLADESGEDLSSLHP